MKGFLRPEMVTLPSDALVPATNRISPPPNRFTHRVTTPAPFHFGTPVGASAPDGEFAPGTLVVLLVQEAEGRCRVASEHGLYVGMEANRLEPL